MARYADRPLQLTDLVGRFEGRSHQAHTRDALACLDRLKDDGRRFWSEGSAELRRWERGCMELRQFLSNLGARRSVESQDLATAMREFIQAFEHHAERMSQMLYGAGEQPHADQPVRAMFEWFSLVFRLSIYALLSGWLDDKHDENLTRTSMSLEIDGDMTTVKVSEERESREMTIPKKYRQAADRI